MSTVKFKAKAHFELDGDNAALGYVAIVEFGAEEVYRGTVHHQDEEMAVDEAERYITGAVARLIRLWCQPNPK